MCPGGSSPEEWSVPLGLGHEVTDLSAHGSSPTDSVSTWQGPLSDPHVSQDIYENGNIPKISPWLKIHALGLGQ